MYNAAQGEHNTWFIKRTKNEYLMRNTFKQFRKLAFKFI